MGHLASEYMAPVQPGDHHQADYVNKMIELLDREIRGEGVISDGMGTCIWQQRSQNFELRRLMLAEDHPGWGIVFMCYWGEWDPMTSCWEFDCSDGCDDWVYAIDWFWGGEGFPYYPDAGATGLFTPRRSKKFGTLWEAVSMDCEAKNDCSGYYGTGTGTGTGTGAGFCAGTYTGVCA